MMQEKNEIHIPLNIQYTFVPPQQVLSVRIRETRKSMLICLSSKILTIYLTIAADPHGRPLLRAGSRTAARASMTLMPK